ICSSRYTVSYNSTTCIVPLDGPCNGQTDCDYGTVCSSSRKCICKLGYDPNGTRCDEFTCNANQQCARFSNFTICDLNECKCEYSPDYKIDPGTQKCVTRHQVIGE